MRIVDFHIHVMESGSQKPWVADFNRGFMSEEELKRLESIAPSDILSIFDECGIERGVILAEISPVTTGIISNEYVARFCRGSDRLIPFACINPNYTARPAEELERCVKELGCKGLKLLPSYHLYYPNDPSIYPVYAKAQDLGIPVLIHTGSSIFRGSRLKYCDPLYLDDVAVDFPHLTIVQAHSGRGFWYDRSFFLAQLHPNVYMEISGLPPSNLLKYFPHLEKLAHKVIFGSDWPGLPSLKENISFIKSLPFREESIRMILGENALKLLKIP